MAQVRKIESSILALPTKKRVAAYARVSSGKDAMLHSLSAQISHYSDYIQKRSDWHYVGVYADRAMTGTKDTRPEFQRLLADCRAGNVDMIITKSISRFARNTVTLLQTTRELKGLGVSVFFERESLYSDSVNGEMILTILAAVAQEESRAVSENCKWRIRNRFKQGDPANWRFLYGYRIEKGCIEIDPEQADVVRRVFAQYLDGWGYARIVRDLEERGIPAYFGGQWQSIQIRNMLKNEKYTGNALLQKAYVPDPLTKKAVRNNGQLPQYYVEQTHEAIIDMDTFQEAQTLIATKSAMYTNTKTEKRRYLFSGLLRCGICSGLYHRRITNASSPYAAPAWICSTFKTRGKAVCASKQIPDDILVAISTDVLGLSEMDETLFAKSVTSITVTPGNVLTFHMTDGRVVEKIWQDRSRSDAWTQDKRRQA